MADRIEIGYVARAHGVRGEVRVVLYNAESDTLETATEVAIGATEYRLKRARSTAKGVLLVLEGVSDRTAAEALKGKPLSVDRDQIYLDEGEVLTVELVGCRAVLSDGADWGEVVAIDAGFQDRLVIHGDGRERLLPLVPDFVGEIDLAAGTVQVFPPEGLPDSPIAAGED